MQQPTAAQQPLEHDQLKIQLHPDRVPGLCQQGIVLQCMMRTNMHDMQCGVYVSGEADLPTTMGFFQPGTSLGTLSTTIGSRKTVPFKILRMVPFGLLHIFFSLNSFTRASSGVIVAHLMPTPLACPQTANGHHMTCQIGKASHVRCLFQPRLPTAAGGATLPTSLFKTSGNTSLHSFENCPL